MRFLVGSTTVAGARDATKGTHEANALSRDILKARISDDKIFHYIHKANECGKEYAKRIISLNQTNDIHIIAKNLKLNLSYKDNYNNLLT